VAQWTVWYRGTGGCTAGRCSAVGLAFAALRVCITKAPTVVFALTKRLLDYSHAMRAHAARLNTSDRQADMADALSRELEIWWCYNHTQYIRRVRTRRRATRQYRLTRPDGTQVITYIRRRDGTYVALVARVQRAQKRAALAAADEANRTAHRTLRQQSARGPPDEGGSPARSGGRCARRAQKRTVPYWGGYRRGGRNTRSNHVGRAR
jgi:hypothetical protein